MGTMDHSSSAIYKGLWGETTMRAFAKNSLRKDDSSERLYINAARVNEQSMGSRTLEELAEIFEMRKLILESANHLHLSKSRSCRRQTESEREHRTHSIAGDVSQNKSAAKTRQKRLDYIGQIQLRAYRVSKPCWRGIQSRRPPPVP